MSIQAIRKTGFLIENASWLGKSIVILQDAAMKTNYPELIGIANWLNELQVGTYYAPVQPKLIADEIEEVA